MLILHKKDHGYFITLRSEIPAESSCFLLCLFSHLADSRKTEMEKSGGWTGRKGTRREWSTRKKAPSVGEERDGAKTL